MMHKIFTGCPYAKQTIRLSFPVEALTVKTEMQYHEDRNPDDAKLIRQFNLVRRRLAHANDDSIIYS